MASTHLRIRHIATPWWVVIVAPLMGVPILVALLALAAQPQGVAMLPGEEEPAAEAVVDFVEVGRDGSLPCLDGKPLAPRPGGGETGRGEGSQPQTA